MSHTAVSVIIPTYNRARTIRRAVDSVLNQTWTPIEVIVVDDGSTDQTAEILASYGNRIKVMHQANAGPSAARNVGIKAAKGALVAFLDSDDLWLPTKIERQVKLLTATEGQGVNCCVCNARMEFTTGTLNSFSVADLSPTISEGIWTNPAEVLLTRFLFFNQVVAVRREALEQIGDFRKNPMEDWDLALRLSLLGPWAFIADPLVVWHQHVGDNLSQTHSQLEVNTRAMEILQDISTVSQRGRLLPEALLRKRVRFLKRKIEALRLGTQRGAMMCSFAKAVLLYLRATEALHRRSPFYPRMVTRAV